VLAAAGVVKRPFLLIIACVAICICHLVYRLAKHHGSLPFILGDVTGTLLIVSFLIGISLYLYRQKIIFDVRLFLVCLTFSAISLGFLRVGGEYIGVVLLGYVTVWLGLTDIRRIFIIRGADLSYGVYLYGYVLQQLFSFIFPQYRYWWLSILVCAPAALAFAAVSWNFIEKPALKLRKPLMRLEDQLFPALGRSGPLAADPGSAAPREL
jgi:peptidoglycan/LPS O-acetylase OafA/YrhL